MKDFAANILVLAILVSGALATEPVARKKPQTVTVDELIERPGAFDGKRIEVEGYWVSGFEWSYLSATPNNAESLPIWFERWATPADSDRIDIEAIKVAIESADRKAGFVVEGHSRQYRVRCVGRFSHVAIRRATPEKPGVGFGHLGVYPSVLRLEKIVEIRAIPLPKDFFPKLPE